MTETHDQNPAAADGATEREDWELQRDACKAEGDTAFRSGRFQEAIQNYTAALGLDPTNHLILSNRSAAHLKVSSKSKALQDAKACIDAKPEFIKGYSRLGAAEQSLGRWQAAIDSYSRVLESDQNNAAAKKGIEECKKQLVLKQKEEQEVLQQNQQEESKESKAPAKEDKEEDLLDSFFEDVENTTTKSEKPAEEKEETGNNFIKEQRSNLGTAQSQIDRLLAPNYKWRNLNPFFVLDISHTSTEDEISRRYKALSLLLHPDKCRDLERAKEAYDEVQRAKRALSDEAKRRHVQKLVEQGMKKGKHKWHSRGETGSLEHTQSKEVQRLFAEIEHKRMEVEKRERKQEQRERDQEEDELKKEKKQRDFDQSWREEDRVENRIGSWRQFQKKGSNKRQKL